MILVQQPLRLPSKKLFLTTPVISPFEKLCISTGYCNPFTYGKRRSLATDPEEQTKQEATGRSLYSTDHRAKYHRKYVKKYDGIRTDTSTTNESRF
jgi:hypothetical protein